MQGQDTTKLKPGPIASDFIIKKSELYLSDLLDELDAQIDSRLVKTFFRLFIAVLIYRNRPNGLILSELGAFICNPWQAKAGTKRLSNLLRSTKWDAGIIDNFLFSKAEKRIEKLRTEGKRPLFTWDDSRLEHPESWLMEGLCSVYSTKGKRLTRIRRGFYKVFKSRICTPGYKWTAVMLSTVGEAPSVCKMSWWTTRGKFKSYGSNIMYNLLKECDQKFGRLITHVLDRGYAKAELIEWMFLFNQDFVLRWKKNHNLIHSSGVIKKTHLIARSAKPMDYKWVKDKERKKMKRISIAYIEVAHPESPDNQLFMIIVRDKKNHNSPMYLLTSLPINSIKDAWEICHIYFHRWNIEQAFRFCKSELAMESPRLWFFQNRLKFLAIISLVYDFIISLIRNWNAWVWCFIQTWCPRTGSRLREVSTPAYRLRFAISLCLTFYWVKQNSG